MTSHYVDLTVVPDPETGVPPLLGALYDRLHRTFVQHRIDTIGVSFPLYTVIPRHLGDTLRLHGSEGSLRELLAGDWLRGVRDHIRTSQIALVPAEVQHRTLQRRQFKSNVERLRRRRMKRKGETAEQAARAIPDSVARTPTLPYVHVRSASTGQTFCLFIALGPVQREPTAGSFNTYGLGGTATVPWF
ncbi:type I-F CRISPR-associated endoribonuclease Cas6/Csy4 [Dokdonella sp. MW10]|uniref:type I-F CRISPR-associated endoribonuclease Cas6/Csy4 n=1 Tax=Dokdonella sp. MW10 TaxID=2992926 RepID=UPI003F7CD7C7